MRHQTRRTLTALAALLILASTSAACSSDKVGGYTETEVVDALKKDFQTETDLFEDPDAVAECMAKKLYATGDADVVKAAVETSDEEDLPEVAVGPAADAASGCVDLKQILVAEMSDGETDNELSTCLNDSLELPNDAAVEFWKTIFSGGEPADDSAVSVAMNEAVASCMSADDPALDPSSTAPSTSEPSA